MRQPRYWGRSPRAASEPAQRGGGPAHFFSLTSATVGQLLFIFTLGFYGFLIPNAWTIVQVMLLVLESIWKLGWVEIVEVGKGGGS